MDTPITAGNHRPARDAGAAYGDADAPDDRGVAAPFFFEAERLKFFRPLNGARRELVVGCLRALYDRLHGPLADYSHHLTRDALKELLLPVVCHYRDVLLDEGNAEDLHDGETLEPNALVTLILRKLLADGWLEQFADRAGLVTAFRFSRPGKLFAQALWSLDRPSRSRQRNMRGCRNALEAALSERGDAHDLVDAYEYAEKVIEDLTDGIDYFQELVRHLMQAASARTQWNEFVEFLERFRRDYSKQLTADNATLNRQAIVQKLERLRKAPAAKVRRMEEQLRDIAHWAVIEHSGPSVFEWLLTRVEDTRSGTTPTAADASPCRPGVVDRLSDGTRPGRDDFQVDPSFDATRVHPELGREMVRYRGRPTASAAAQFDDEATAEGGRIHHGEDQELRREDADPGDHLVDPVAASAARRHGRIPEHLGEGEADGQESDQQQRNAYQPRIRSSLIDVPRPEPTDPAEVPRGLHGVGVGNHGRRSPRMPLQAVRERAHGLVPPGSFTVGGSQGLDDRPAGQLHAERARDLDGVRFQLRPAAQQQIPRQQRDAQSQEFGRPHTDAFGQQHGLAVSPFREPVRQRRPGTRQQVR
jgi:Family of unknown function (DUF5716)